MSAIMVLYQNNNDIKTYYDRAYSLLCKAKGSENRNTIEIAIRDLVVIVFLRGLSYTKLKDAVRIRDELKTIAEALTRVTKCKDKLDEDIKDKDSTKAKVEAIELKELGTIVIRGIATIQQK